MDERVARYLDHVRFEKRLAERTSTLYAIDLHKLSELNEITVRFRCYLKM